MTPPLSSHHVRESRHPSPPMGSAAVITRNRDTMNFGAACLLAFSAHAVFILLLAITYFVLTVFFGIKIIGFEPPTVKPKDIEFVLVENNKPEPPRNKQTKNRSDRMSRSGGQKVQNRPQAVPTKAAGRPTPKPQPQQSANRPAPKPVPAKPRVTPRPTPKPQPQPAPAPTPTPKPTPKPQPARPPAPKTPTNERPNIEAPKLPPSPTGPLIKLPAPAPNPSAVSSGPVVSSGGPVSSSHGGGPGVVGPQAIPGNLSRNVGGGNPGSSSRSGQAGGAGGTGSNNQSGSPGGGGGRPGIDAMPEPDFGPYISELQRRIKRNWNPPSSDRSKRVVALFTIGRQGQLLSVRLKNTSGSPSADEAAISAVRASAPFRPLPANYRSNSIDVEFIFDYDVYTGGRLR